MLAPNNTVQFLSGQETVCGGCQGTGWGWPCGYYVDFPPKIEIVPEETSPGL